MSSVTILVVLNILDKANPEDVVQWSSNKKKIASVNEFGEVTGLKKGKAVITAKIGKKKYKATVTVKKRQIKINPAKTTIEKNQHIFLQLLNKKDEDQAVWTTSNDKVVIVAQSGEIAGVKPGKATITAQDGTKQKLNADTRVCFSYVPQGNTLLAGSIAENLSIAKEGASREEMKTALEMACAWEFVKKLQEGLETKLGERGKGLSEGQSQRIAIARALLRNAPVILLDEATSALDEETEKKLLKNILEKAPEKTCIVTTHRPGVLRLCRRVYRVEDGKIAEMSDLGEERK